MAVDCERVGLDYFTNAPFRYTAAEVVDATPERVFEVFADGEAWRRWVQAITAVEWTSPPPYGAGTTRTVRMVGGLVAWEEFLAWEPGRRIAFRVNEVSRPVVRAFAEEYRVTDVGLGQSRIEWTMALTPPGPARRGVALAGPAVAFGVRDTLRRLRRLLAATAPTPG